MEDALPSFLQTAWSYVVRDIDKTVHRHGGFRVQLEGL